MDREIRHPHQILYISELIVGNNYYFIIKNKIEMIARPHTFVGVIQDSYVTASKNGYNLNTIPKSLIACEMFVNSTMIDTTWIIRNKPKLDMFTIHQDGWMPLNQRFDDSTLVYWGKDGEGWDYVNTFCGNTEFKGATHHIVVPQKDWNDDPRVHILDWENPNHITKRVNISITESPVDWERRMKAKKHEAMRKVLGF